MADKQERQRPTSGGALEECDGMPFVLFAQLRVEFQQFAPSAYVTSLTLLAPRKVRSVKLKLGINMRRLEKGVRMCDVDNHVVGLRKIKHVGGRANTLTFYIAKSGEQTRKRVWTSIPGDRNLFKQYVGLKMEMLQLNIAIEKRGIL